MSDRADHNEPPFSFRCRGYQPIERRTGKKSFLPHLFRILAVAASPDLVHHVLGKRRIEQCGIDWCHSVKFIDVNENKLGTEPSRHRRGDVRRFRRRGRRISPADNRLFLGLFHTFNLLFFSRIALQETSSVLLNRARKIIQPHAALDRINRRHPRLPPHPRFARLTGARRCSFSRCVGSIRV
jgi:hypothetical protein